MILAIVTMSVVFGLWWWLGKPKPAISRLSLPSMPEGLPDIPKLKKAGSGAASRS